MEAALIDTHGSAEAAARIRNYLDEARSRGWIAGRSRNIEIYPSAVTPERADLLSEICRTLRPAATLEVGMASGISTLTILAETLACESLRGPHVVMDPFQSSAWDNAALLSLRRLGIESLVEFHEEPSAAVLARLVAQRRTFDFAFIDGSHRFDFVFLDFRLIHDLLRPGGVVVFDDTWMDPVYLVGRYAETNLGYALCGERYFDATGGRPAIRAYAKPLTEVRRPCQHFESCGCGHFVPFFEELSTGASVGSEDITADTLASLGASARDNPIELYDRLIGDLVAARVLLRNVADARGWSILEKSIYALGELGAVTRAQLRPEDAAPVLALNEFALRSIRTAREYGYVGSLEPVPGILRKIRERFSAQAAPSHEPHAGAMRAYVELYERLARWCDQILAGACDGDASARQALIEKSIGLLHAIDRTIDDSGNLETASRIRALHSFAMDRLGQARNGDAHAALDGVAPVFRTLGEIFEAMQTSKTGATSV